MRREFWRAGIVLLASVALFLISLESLFYVFVPDNLSPAEGAYMHVPDHRYVVPAPWGGYEQEGLFSRLKEEASGGSLKILVLGDSISEFGNYTAPLERIVSEEFGEGARILNSGTSGYDAGLEFGFLENRGLLLEPDFVIIQLCVNDVLGTPVVSKDPFGRMFVYDRSTLSGEIIPWLFSSSRAYRYFAVEKLKSRYAQMKAPLEGPKESFCRGVSGGAFGRVSRKLLCRASSVFGDETYPYPSSEALSEEFRGNLERLSLLLEERGIPHVFVQFPPFSSGERETEHYSIYVNSIRASRVNSIDLSGYYGNSSFLELSPDGWHPSAYGGEISARAIFADILPDLCRISGNYSPCLSEKDLS